MIPETKADINYWASKKYLEQQMLSARVDVEDSGQSLLPVLLAQRGYTWASETAVYKRGKRNVSLFRVKAELQQYLAVKKKSVAGTAQDYVLGRTSLEKYTDTMRENILNAHLTALALGAGGWDNVGDQEYDNLNNFMTRGQKDKDKKGELAYLLLLLAGLGAGNIVVDMRVVNRSTQYISAANVTYEEERQQQVINTTPQGLSVSESVELQQLQWDAQQLEEEARKAEAAARRAREKANKPDATESDKAEAEAAEARATEARQRADAAQRKADEKLDAASKRAVDGTAWEMNIRHARDSCFGCIHESKRGKVPVGALIPVGYRVCRNACLCTIQYGIYGVN